MQAPSFAYHDHHAITATMATLAHACITDLESGQSHLHSDSESGEIIWQSYEQGSLMLTSRVITSISKNASWT